MMGVAIGPKVYRGKGKFRGGQRAAPVNFKQSLGALAALAPGLFGVQFNWK